MPLAVAPPPPRARFGIGGARDRSVARDDPGVLPSDSTSVPIPTGDTGAPNDSGGCSEAFADRDGDGFGDPAEPVLCDDPAAVADGTDCDDADLAVHPGAAEACDRIDGDCDPSTGEDQLVTLRTGGATLDVTADFAGGTAGSPAVIELVDGTYDVCAGTWYVRLRGLQTATTIDGHEGAVLDGGRSGSVIALDGGTVTLVDLTVTGGQGSRPLLGGALLGGGGLACSGGAGLTIDGATFSDNAAEVGGGWLVDDCTVTATATTVSGNAATYGGGLYALNGLVELVGSTVTGNSADSSGGGIGLEGLGPRPVLTLTDTLVADNTALFGGGLVVYENAEATCTGAVGLTAGFLRNTATGIGGAIYVTGADYAPGFVADTCDFGTGVDDNVPTDVETSYAAQLAFPWGDDASFSCTRDGCD